MRAPAIAVAAVLLSVSSFAVAKPAASPADAFMDKFAQAWSQDDAAALVGMLADDVVLVGDPEVISGKEAVADWVKRQLASTSALTVKAVRSGASGDVAYQVGRWTLGIAKGGTSSGNHTFVLKKGHDGWKIAAMHINDDPRPATKSP